MAIRPGWAAVAIGLACVPSAPRAEPAGAPCQRDWSQPRPAMVGVPPDLAPLVTTILGPAAGQLADLRRGSDDTAIGALMFELDDVAIMQRAFTPAELAPYAHQFHGDMMTAPQRIPIARLAGRPVVAAVNRRPDSPLPDPVGRLLAAALSPAGQSALAAVPGAEPLEPAELQAARAALAGFAAALDPALPSYQRPTGLAAAISSVGSDGMKALLDSWVCRFEAIAPDVRHGPRWEHLGTLNGFNALLVGQADMAPMGRELWPSELAGWDRTFPGAPPPTEIMVARGGFNTQQRTTAQAIFVNPANPLRQIGVDQLAGILGDTPSITRWGQLGLGGEWADRPIAIRTPPLAAPNAMSMQTLVLGGRAWNPAAVPGPIAATAQAISNDPAAIGFGGLEEGAPGLRTLAIVPRGGQGAVALDAESASSGRYPFTRGLFIRLPPGPVPAAVAEFLRFALSRDGQARVISSGYFPLSAAEAARERGKLPTP